MFRDRTEVGKLLAQRILKTRIGNPIVLAIPRGGVPVAREIALALGCKLDLVITRKIGFPGQPEFAIGAVSQDGEVMVDKEIVRSYGVNREYLKEESARQRKEIKDRLQKYRGEMPYPDLTGSTVIIVDDGVATGSTILAAIDFVKRKRPAAIILATGVAPPDTVARLSGSVDQIVCLDTPKAFFAIGEFYERFEQVEDDEVRRILKEVNLDLRHTTLH